MLRLMLILARLLCHPCVDGRVHRGVWKGVVALRCLRCLEFWGGVSRECLDSPHLSTWRCRSPLALSETTIARLRRVWHNEIAVHKPTGLDHPPGPPGPPVPNARLILHRGGRLRGRVGGCSPYKQIAAGRSPLDASSPLAFRCILVTFPQRRCALPAVFLARLAISRLGWKQQHRNGWPQQQPPNPNNADLMSVPRHVSAAPNASPIWNVLCLPVKWGPCETGEAVNKHLGGVLEVASLLTQQPIGAVYLECHLLSLPATGEKHVSDKDLFFDVLEVNINNSSESMPR